MDIRRRSQIGGIKKTSSGGGSYTVNLNNEWELTTAVPNPGSTLYDGVYRSASSYNVNNGVSIMYITITDCSSFRMYIRSYAESTWDYMMVSQLDQTINGNTSYSNTTLVKAHTSGNQQSGTTLSSYTLVEFTGIPSGMHTITVVYRKDSSVNSGDDRGYVLIEKMPAGSGDSGSGGDDEGPINIDNYLTIEALEDGLTASLSVNACEYCVDGDGNWKTLDAGTATESISAGHTLSFRGNLIPTSSNSGIGTFTISKTCNLKGNCMSMLFGDNAADNYSLSGKGFAFYKLFYNCNTLKSVSANFLPATTLSSYCYYCMFFECRNLTTAPELPATRVEDYCYYQMFGYSSIAIPPTLPATVLASHCYCAMFYKCTKLTTAPDLPAKYMYFGCYDSMFAGCSSLTTAPELPATSLSVGCYNSMFSGTNLTIAPVLPATTLMGECYYGMFSGCKKLTNAPKLPATTLKTACYRSMFDGCTSLTTAPELPATTLVEDCYRLMFLDCKNLKYIKMLATDISAGNCLSSWLHNVSSTGTFVKHPDMTALPTGTSGIPSGWTVVNDGEKSGGNIITLRPYPEMSQEEGLTLLDFFTAKYGIPYGTKNNPIPIDEIVQTSGFNYISDSEVSHIYIDNDGNIQFRNDFVWDYYCVRLTHEGYCESFMWD